MNKELIDINQSVIIKLIHLNWLTMSELIQINLFIIIKLINIKY